MDSDWSSQYTPPLSPTSGASQMEQRGVRPGPLDFQHEPAVGKVHPDASSLLCPNGGIPIGQHQPAAATLETRATKAVNQSTQHVRNTFIYYTEAQ